MKLEGKTAIFGKRGIGKTHMLINETIPLIKAKKSPFLVIDFINEYQHYNIYPRIEIEHKNRKQLVDAFLENLRIIPTETYLIIDCATLLFLGSSNPDVIRQNQMVMDALNGYNCCLVFVSISELYRAEIIDEFDNYLLFPTHDERFETMLYADYGDQNKIMCRI